MLLLRNLEIKGNSTVGNVRTFTRKCVNELLTNNLSNGCFYSRNDHGYAVNVKII